MASQAKKAAQEYGGGAEQIKKDILAQMAKTGEQAGSVEDIGKMGVGEGSAAALEMRIKSGQADPATVAAFVFAKSQAAEARENLRKANEDYAKQEAGAFVRGEPEAIGRMRHRAVMSPEMFQRKGPGGLTFGEALKNLPDTPEETLRRIDEDEDAKLREEHEKETSKRFKEGRKKQKDAKNDRERQEKDEAQAQDHAWKEDIDRWKRQADTRKAAVREAVQQQAGGMEAALGKTALMHEAGIGPQGQPMRPMTADQSFAQLIPQVTARLKANSIADDIAEDVAREILQKAMDKVGRKIEAAQLAGGGGEAQVAAHLLEQTLDKMTQGNIAHVRTQGRLDRLQGKLTENTILLNQLEARERNMANAHPRTKPGRTPARSKR
jgi:hypothetical protein